MDVVMDIQENIAPNTPQSSFEINSKNISQKKVLADVEMDEDKTNDIRGAIRSLIEFYFSTANLYNDSHLRKLMLSNQEQRVDLDVLLSFSRLR
jgi:hypothetical protein